MTSRIRHGESQTKLYRIWKAIRERCANLKHISYQWYGKKGISVCREWLEYIPFRDWALVNGYREGLTIDRIDGNGNYEPNNCRFVPMAINRRNQSSVKLNQNDVDLIRKKHTTGNYSHMQLAKEYNVSKTHITSIVNFKKWKDLN